MLNKAKVAACLVAEQDIEEHTAGDDVILAIKVTFLLKITVEYLIIVLEQGERIV